MVQYSKTESGEIIEHFDNKEELEASIDKSVLERSFFIGFLFFVAGGIITYFLLENFGLGDTEKWIRFTTILAAASALGVFGYKFGALIITFALLIAFASGIIGAGWFLWSVI